MIKTITIFTKEIYNAEGIGKFNFKNDNADLSVAQICEWNEENFICGSGTGFDIRVIITSASNNPSILEATFGSVFVVYV